MLMTTMFDQLSKHPDIDGPEALREAMLSMINNVHHPAWADPTIWAPFVIVGEPQLHH